MQNLRECPPPGQKTLKKCEMTSLAQLTSDPPLVFRMNFTSGVFSNLNHSCLDNESPDHKYSTCCDFTQTQSRPQQPAVMILLCACEQAIYCAIVNVRRSREQPTNPGSSNFCHVHCRHCTSVTEPVKKWALANNWPARHWEITIFCSTLSNKCWLFLLISWVIRIRFGSRKVQCFPWP